uniref:Uncharacterized protein n=1 Tax=Anguilla anguilla TaxID=7936 RepID=A0A0E9PKP8_ANGAN
MMSWGCFCVSNVEIILRRLADSRYPVPFTHHGKYIY